ncbi:Ig-like domain-containing protein [Roseiflexus sp.]|uniref:Ig-like domain-containing protein n=1 Tax=Roseiflexus sp. TaxID=2562120 RepID=UPI00398B6239
MPPLYRRFALLLVVAMIITACGGPRPQPTPTPVTAQPTPVAPRRDIPQPPAQAAPILVARSPAPGQALDPGEPVELVFDRPMDRSSVAAALTIAGVTGAVEWPDARTVRFVPAAPLRRAAAYEVMLRETATSADGVPLAAPVRFRFATAGFLEVGQVIPADGTTDVQPDSTITVFFNRPVVPLTAVETQTGLPQPLTFDPPIAGRGEWLNTAIYTFKPAAPLAGGSTYTGRIAAGLTDVTGNPLQSEYTWRFTVARPQVVTVEPFNGATLVPLQPSITLRFNVPVDPASARTAFRLRNPDGADIPGDLQVAGETLVFTPSQRLAFDTRYTVEADASLTGASGGLGMAGDFRATFQTVPRLQVLETDPRDGETDAPRGGLTIRFNAPVDPDTVMPNVTITPQPTQVYTYFNGYDNSFVIGFDTRPSTEYTAFIGPDIADPYGNRTGQSLTVRFRTEPLEPWVYPLTPGFVTTFDASRAPRLALMATNINRASLALYRLPVEALLRRELLAPDGASPPTGATLVRRWQEQISVPRDEPTPVRINLVEGGGRLDPGLYLLVLNQPSTSFPEVRVLVVSPLHLTLKAAERNALVWANDLTTGAPVPGLALELFDDQGASLGTVTTDANGVAKATLSRTEYREMVAVARQPFAIFGTDWGSGVSPWDFGLQASYDLPEVIAYVYTDRPIYRPGQRVWFKGVVRADDDVRYTLIQGLNAAQVTAYNAAGEVVFQQTVNLNQNGAFDGGFTLAAGAPTGQYAISLNIGSREFRFPFQVAAYRPPEIEVTVTPRAAEIVRGTSTETVVRAGYFFGAPAANLPVQWNVLAEPFVPAPDWAGRYTFGEYDDLWVCRFCWWRPAPPPQTILSGSATTDAQGQAIISLPTELRDTEGNVITRSVRLTVEATVTGRDNQAISGRSTIIVHAGGMYVGLAPRTYVGRTGVDQQIDLVTIDARGNRLANRTVEIELVRVSWDNRFVQDDTGERWESREVRESAGTQTVTTGANGEATISFKPDKSGAYLVLARVRDAGGREVRSSLYVWVYGNDIPWPRENDDRIDLIADKSEYRPGETATILIPSPFTETHWALLTVERGGVLSHEVRQVSGGSLVYQLPITADHAPNIFVSAVLLAPPGNNGAPADYKIGLLPLSVVPVIQTLQIEVSAATPQAAPGDTTTFEVRVTDANGAPVAAELSLDLVDKSVLSLQPREPDALVQAFYGRRPLGVFTSAGLSVSAERFEQLLDETKVQDMAPSGAAGPQIAVPMAGAPPETAAPTAVPAAMPEAMPARANEAALPQGLTVREEFADTAFWQAVVTTNAAGRATVQVTLPDNLTTWVMRGVAITADTRVGEGIGELVSTKPLLVRPVTPRFFVVGDVVELAANVSNLTNTSLSVEVTLNANGVTVNSPLTQTIQVPANGEAQAIWQITVLDVESVDLVFSAVSGSLSDAARPRLANAPEGRIPVYRYTAPETVATGGQIEAAGARVEAVALPPNVDARQGELRIRLDPSLAAGILDGLRALEEYPYESVEATVSLFVPNVVALRTLRQLGVTSAELEARLPAQVADALDHLYLWQNPDGGWGWWSDDESNPYVSAYVVFGMLRAREGGFAVRDDVLARGLEYLSTQLDADADVRTAPQANRQAWLLYVLADGGRPDSSRMNALYQNRERLGVYGKALLALALHRVNTSDTRLKTLLSDLNNAAIVSATGIHWEEAEHDYWGFSSDTRSSAIALQALVRLDPQNQLIPNAVRWLMVARRGDIWLTTQESVWGLLALTDWMSRTAELNGAYDYAVWLNGDERIAGRIDATNVMSPTVVRVPTTDLPTGATSLLAVGRSEGQGRLYYTAHLNLALPADQVKALDRGIVVTRRYVAADCTDGPQCPALNSARVGDMVRVELSIVAERDLYYFQMEDFLPAGGEAIDPTLATTAIATQTGPILQPVFDASMPSFWWWRWHWYDRVDLRDEKVALFASYLPRGAYVFSYTFRAVQPGEYRVIPAIAQESFFPEVFGRSDGQRFIITR